MSGLPFFIPDFDCFQTHKLEQLPGQPRKFKSICQQRYLCEQCRKWVFKRGHLHQCGQTAANEDICEICGGRHRWCMPCYIQPVAVDKLNSLLQKHRRPVKNPRSIDITETDDDETDEEDHDDALTTSTSAAATKAAPYRYFIFDIECAQENEVSAGRFKHEALLVCAELICTECINKGIRIGVDDNPPRPATCICKGADSINHRARRWVVPIPMVDSSNSTISTIRILVPLMRCSTFFAIMVLKKHIRSLCPITVLYSIN